MLQFPLAPAQSARLLVHLQKRMAGGVGSGNFDHGGRPGEIGGSGKAWHGTSKEHLDSILKNGLQASYSGAIWPDFSKQGHVYVTTNLEDAQNWARETARRSQLNPEGRIPVVLEVAIPNAELRHLHEDTNFIGNQPTNKQFHGDIKSEWIRSAWTQPSVDPHGYSYDARREKEWVKVLAETDVLIVYVPFALKVDEPKALGGPGSGRYPKGSGEVKIITDLKKRLGTTTLPYETRFLLPDGTRIKGQAGDYHNTVPTTDTHTKSAGGADQLNALLDAGVLRYVPEGGGNFAQVPTEAQAQILADDWNYVYKDYLVLDGQKAGGDAWGYLGNKQFNLPIHPDAIRNWAKRLIENPLDRTLGGPGSGRYPKGSGNERDPENIIGRLYDRAKGHSRVLLKLTTVPRETRFLLPDGTRIAAVHSDDEHRELAQLAVNTTLDKVMEAGVVRYNGGMGGIQFIGAITEQQAQVIADDWNIVYDTPVFIDAVQMKDGTPDYDHSTAGRLTPPFTADRVRNFSKNPPQKPAGKQYITLGGPGSGRYPAGSGKARREIPTQVHTAGDRVQLPGRYDRTEVPKDGLFVTTPHGYITAIPSGRFPAGEYLWVAHIRVDDKFQGQGEGTHLFETAFKEATARGYKGLLRGDTEGRPASDSAQAVWKKFEGRTAEITDEKGFVHQALVRPLKTLGGEGSGNFGHTGGAGGVGNPGGSGAANDEARSHPDLEAQSKTGIAACNKLLDRAVRTADYTNITDEQPTHWNDVPQEVQDQVYDKFNEDLMNSGSIDVDTSDLDAETAKELRRDNEDILEQTIKDTISMVADKFPDTNPALIIENVNESMATSIENQFELKDTLDPETISYEEDDGDGAPLNYDDLRMQSGRELTADEKATVNGIWENRYEKNFNDDLEIAVQSDKYYEARNEMESQVMEESWNGMSSQEKYDLISNYGLGVGTVQHEVSSGLPDHWVTGMSGEMHTEDYDRSRAIANKLSELRTDEIRAERGLMTAEQVPPRTYEIREDTNPNSENAGFYQVFSKGRIVGQAVTVEEAKSQADEWVKSQQTLDQIKADRATTSSADLIEATWREWKSTSSSDLGLALQLATAKELGGVHRLTENEVIRANQAADAYGGLPNMQAYVRAQWEVTQTVMEKAGETHVEIYRGLMLDGDDLKKTTNSYTDKLGGELKPINIKELKSNDPVGPGGDHVVFDFNGNNYVVAKERIRILFTDIREIKSPDTRPYESTQETIDRKMREIADHSDVFVKLPDLALKRAGAASTTATRSVANDWGGVGVKPPNATRVVLRVYAPRTSALSIPVFGQNVFEEREVVLAGTKDKWQWDAWKGKAPDFASQSVGRKKLKAASLRMLQAKLLIDLQALDRNQPHWMSNLPDGVVTRARERRAKVLKTLNQADLKDKYGIEQFEFPTPSSTIKHIGYAPQSQKWYGWSHRAIFGFGVGAEVRAGDVIAEGTAEDLRDDGPGPFPVGFKAQTLDDAKKMATQFALEVSEAHPSSLQTLGGPGSGRYPAGSGKQPYVHPSQSELDRIADTEIARQNAIYRAKYKSEPNEVLYHGTSSEVLKTIKTQGLVPILGKGADAFVTGVGGPQALARMQIGDRKLSVFVTDDIDTAQTFAGFAKRANPGSEAIILQIMLPKGERNKITFDEQADPDMGAWKYKGTIKPEWIKRVTGSGYGDVTALAAADSPIYLTFLVGRKVITLGGPGSGRYPLGSGGPHSTGFKEWFGKSQVVDEQGQPLVVYRGDVPMISHQPIPGERPYSGRSGPEIPREDLTFEPMAVAWADHPAIYFTDDESKAHYFATSEGYQNYPKAFYIKAEKIATPDILRELVRQQPASFDGNRDRATTASGLTKSEVDLLKQHGYDAIKGGIDTLGGTEWAVFSPDQVKIDAHLSEKARLKVAGGPGSGRYPKGSGVAATMTKLAEKYPNVAARYDEHSGTEMGTIGEHTKDVAREWPKQISSQELAAISDRWGSNVNHLMDHALALHDIGKSEAIEHGDKNQQHEFTIPILQSVLKSEGFSDEDINLSTELFNHDRIGQLLQGSTRYSQQQIADEFVAKAERIGMPVADFVTLQLAVYHADAGAYPFVKDNFMKADASGKLSMHAQQKLTAITALLPKKRALGGPGSGRYPKGSGDDRHHEHSGLGTLESPAQVWRAVRGEVADARVPRPEYGFTTYATNKHMSDTYIEHGKGEAKPFTIAAKQVIEFPVTKNKYGGGNNFDKFAFDRRARELADDEVLVARQVVDSGPWGSNERDPDRLFSYSADVYAVKNPALVTVGHTRKRALGGAGSGNFGHTGGEGGVGNPGGSGAAAKSFTSEEGYQWHETGPVAEWAKALPYEDHQALGSYSGFGYHDTNDRLRGTFEPRIINEFVRAATPEEIARLGYDPETGKWIMPKDRDPNWQQDPRDQRNETFGMHFGMTEQLKNLDPNDPWHRVDDGHLVIQAGYRPVPGGPEVFISVQRAVPDMKYVEQLDRSAAHLNDLIAERGYALPETIEVGRAAYLPGVSYEDLQGMVHGTFEEKGFTSTMLGDAQGRLTGYVASGKYESINHRFENEQNNLINHQDEVGSAIRMHISLPEGTHVASIEASRRLEFEHPRIQDPDVFNHPEWTADGKLKPEDFTKKDYTQKPTVNDERLKDKSHRSESEILIGSGAQYRVTKVERGEEYRSGDPTLKPVKIIDMYMTYIGGGSSSPKKLIGSSEFVALGGPGSGRYPAGSGEKAVKIPKDVPAHLHDLYRKAKALKIRIVVNQSGNEETSGSYTSPIHTIDGGITKDFVEISIDRRNDDFWKELHEEGKADNEKWQPNELSDRSIMAHEMGHVLYDRAVRKVDSYADEQFIAKLPDAVQAVIRQTRELDAKRENTSDSYGKEFQAWRYAVVLDPAAITREHVDENLKTYAEGLGLSDKDHQRALDVLMRYRHRYTGLAHFITLGGPGSGRYPAGSSGNADGLGLLGFPDGPMDVGQAEFITLYHGTTSNALASIKEKGLVPSGQAGGDAWRTVHFSIEKDSVEALAAQVVIDERKASVFLTPSMHDALGIARIVANLHPGSEPVILGVAASMTSGLNKPDEQWPGNFRHLGTISPYFIKGVLDTTGLESTPKNPVFKPLEQADYYVVVCLSNDPKTLGGPGSGRYPKGSGDKPDLMDEFLSTTGPKQSFDWPEAGGHYTMDKSGSHVLDKVSQAEEIINTAKAEGRPVLFHSGDASIDEKLANGIEPTFGSWLEEVMSGATDDEGLAQEIRDQDPTSFFSTEPDWVAMKTGRAMDKFVGDVTLDDIRQHGQLSIIGIAAREPQEYTRNSEGKNVLSMTEEESKLAWDKYEKASPGADPDDFMIVGGKYHEDVMHFGTTKNAGLENVPFGVEPNDIFSKTTVVPDVTLTGDALVEFMTKHYPQHLPKAKP